MSTTSTITLFAGGRERRLRLVSPEHPRDDAILLYLHGSRQSGAVSQRFTANTFDALADRLDLPVAYLEGVGHHFNDARRHLPEQTRAENVDDVAYARAVVDYLGAPPKVFAAGYSNGGHMVLRLLRDAPGLLSGAALLAATLPTPENTLPAPQPHREWVPTPIIAFHGTEDPMSPYGGGVAGIDPASSRGEVLSAPESARRLARLNGEEGPGILRRISDHVEVADYGSVQLWTIHGMGHVVPAPKKLPASVGPTTDEVVAADVIADFFGLAGR